MPPGNYCTSSQFEVGQSVRTSCFSVPVSLCSLSRVIICLFFHIFLFKSNPRSRERKHRVTVLGFNCQKHLSEPKLHFPWSYVVHSYVPLDLGKFQYALTCATLGLSEQLQICNSTVCNNYQRDSSVGLDFGRPVRRYRVFFEDSIRIYLDPSTPLRHPST